MLILKQKTNTRAYVDQIGNLYPNMAIALAYTPDVCKKTFKVQLKYFKDQTHIHTGEPILVDEFVWTDTSVTPTDVNGQPIVWATFMATVPRNTWKDVIQQIGRVAFDGLDAGLTIQIAGGLDFAANPVGQAWKEIMLFLPVNSQFARQTSTKFLDESFEYVSI